jgi:hypothetical protein
MKGSTETARLRKKGSADRPSLVNPSWWLGSVQSATKKGFQSRLEPAEFFEPVVVDAAKRLAQDVFQAATVRPAVAVQTGTNYRS